MKNIKIKLNHHINDSYSIFFTRDFLNVANFVRKEFTGNTCVIITDDTVKKLYGEKLRAKIKKSGQKVFLFFGRLKCILRPIAGL